LGGGRRREEKVINADLPLNPLTASCQNGNGKSFFVAEEKK